MLGLGAFGLICTEQLVEEVMALEQRDGKVQATKHDSGKPMMSLYPARAYEATCQVFTYGGVKYSIGNWHDGEGFDWQRLSDAALRHIWAFLLGEDNDPESGLPHLAHAQCCIAMLLEHQLTNHGSDTRHRAQFIPEAEGVKS